MDDFLNKGKELSEKAIDDTPDYLKKDLSKKNPLPWQRYIDPGVSDVVNSQLGRVYGTSDNAFDPNNINADGSYKEQPTKQTDSYTQNIERGVNFSGGTPKPTGNAMLDAINNKYANQFANKYAGLATNNKINKPVYQSSQLARTGSVLGNIQANEMANFKEQYAFQQQRQQMYNQWQQEQERAKGGFLSSLLQIGLGAIATFATGGAAAPALLAGGASALGNMNGAGGNADQG